MSFAKQMIEEGLIDGDPMFQFCLGIPWGAENDPETIEYLKSRIPDCRHLALVRCNCQL